MLFKTHLYYFIFNQIHYFLREDTKITEGGGNSAINIVVSKDRKEFKQ